jgi:uncharacterized protein related to proFAR isomerase
MKKQKLISDTGTGKKIIINLDVAEKNLSEEDLNELYEMLNHLNHIQENVIA